MPAIRDDELNKQSPYEPKRQQRRMPGE